MLDSEKATSHKSGAYIRALSHLALVDITNSFEGHKQSDASLRNTCGEKVKCGERRSCGGPRGDGSRTRDKVEKKKISEILVMQRLRLVTGDSSPSPTPPPQTRHMTSCDAISSNQRLIV